MTKLYQPNVERKWSLKDINDQRKFLRMCRLSRFLNPGISGERPRGFQSASGRVEEEERNYAGKFLRGGEA